MHIKIIQEKREITNPMSISPLLQKFEITALNAMQEEAHKAISAKSDVVLLSPTGTGKTLAFLLPLIENLDPDCTEIQLLILVPSRELAQQIEQVVRKMGSGYKVNAIYGGRAGALDKIDLKHRPAILIGTPGRVADKLRRETFPTEFITSLVLDEFDKSLEIGYEAEMAEIMKKLPKVKQRILTSATIDAKIPGFVGLRNPVNINHMDQGTAELTIKTLHASDKDKLVTLKKTLDTIGHEPGIIFCNFIGSLDRISNFLTKNKIAHECIHGGLEQIDRELALIKFRNGTSKLLVATDLAARGLDIPEIKFIIHYQLPTYVKEFTHRNGRTARMNSDGAAYILHYKEDTLPDYVKEIGPKNITVGDLYSSTVEPSAKWLTLYITGGRRDKISKGDIAGLLLKQGGIEQNQLGIIELQQNCSYAAVHSSVAHQLIEKTNNTRLKKTKVRVSIT